MLEHATRKRLDSARQALEEGTLQVTILTQDHGIVTATVENLQKGKSYTVLVAPKTLLCTCEDFAYRHQGREGCKHIYATIEMIERRI